MLREKLQQLPDIVSAIIYVIIGFCLIIFCEQITPAIPYVFGALLCLNGLLRVIKYFTQKLYKLADNSNLIIASILLALGVVFICSPARGLELFALFWGIHAIISGVECLHRIFYYASRKQKWLVYLGEGIIEFVLGVMLLIEFGEGITTHLIILGVYLVLFGIFGIFGIKLEKHGEKPIENEQKSGIAAVLEEFDDLGDFIPDRADFSEIISKQKDSTPLAQEAPISPVQEVSTPPTEQETSTPTAQNTSTTQTTQETLTAPIKQKTSKTKTKQKTLQHQPNKNSQ